MINYNDQIKDGGNVLKVANDYLFTYLPLQKGASPHTIRSYRKSLDDLMAHIANLKNKKTDRLTFDDFTKENITSYLDGLTVDKKSDATRNQRRACFCSFFSYAVTVHPTLGWLNLQVHKVPIRRQNQKCAEGALTLDEINLLLRKIEENPNMRQRFRDKLIVFMLYDTAARIAELLTISMRDIYLDRKDPYVILRGKGKKTRPVTLSKETITLLEDYAKINALNLSSYSAEPLFYCNHCGMKMPLHSDTIRRMLNKYEWQIKEETPSFAKHIHPHLLRASRATHLMDQGKDVFTISKFLGHSDLTTTTRYLRIGTDQINQAIQKSSEDKNNPLHTFLNPNKVNWKMPTRYYSA